MKLKSLQKGDRVIVWDADEYPDCREGEHPTDKHVIAVTCEQFTGLGMGVFEEQWQGWCDTEDARLLWDTAEVERISADEFKERIRGHGRLVQYGNPQIFNKPILNNEIGLDLDSGKRIVVEGFSWGIEAV